MSRRNSTRRRVLGWAGAGVAAFLPLSAFGAETSRSSRVIAPRALAFLNLHTGESVKAVYWSDGHYLPDALAAIDYVLRDHRSGEVAAMNRRLLDLLYALQQRIGLSGPLQVISGFRSPKTNEMLAQRSGGVAVNSLHTRGNAIDIRVPGMEARQVARAARQLQAGGVGLYSRSDFVHVDIGRVRSWGS